MSHSNQDTQVSIESYHGTLKHWFSLETKGFKGYQIDWLVWRMIITITQHYMDTFEMKKKVHKKEGCGTYCENKCGESNVDPIHACIPNLFLK
jgi:hypothetical protein